MVMMVLPRFRSSAITLAIRATLTASCPVVGSSKMTMCVSIEMMDAMATIFRQVADRSYGLTSVLSVSSVKASASLTSAWSWLPLNPRLRGPKRDLSPDVLRE